MLRDRQKVIARIVPEAKPHKPSHYPDFAARRKKLFGNRILPNAVLEERERSRY